MLKYLHIYVNVLVSIEKISSCLWSHLNRRKGSQWNYYIKKLERYNKLVSDESMPEMHLRQHGFIWSASGSVTKITKFTEEYKI